MFVFQFYNKVIVRFYKRYDAFGLTDHFGYNYGFTQKNKIHITRSISLLNLGNLARLLASS